MWPWRRRVEVVLASSAGDDATAALTMILRYHRRPGTFDEVRRAIYEDRTDASAAHVVKAAERFHLRGRGYGLEDSALLARIPTPCIAHMKPDRGPVPRASDAAVYGYFAVVAAISSHRVRWIDPYVGQIDNAPVEFFTLASGTFLVFDKAASRRAGPR
jgi:ABC-type bacteriocin/lantibiotic exporter with double-glycine peptidase domain